MKETYHISGMTCSGCSSAVAKALNAVNAIEKAEVDLPQNSATIEFSAPISLPDLQHALPDKYKISPIAVANDSIPNPESKISQLKPLLLILLYISSASLLLHRSDFNLSEIMLDFMGLFFLVFSFFKLLDLKGFPDSFRMYDPVAKRFTIYAKVYPFLESILALMFLFRYQIQIALWVTLIILAITTWGVARSLLDKKAIRCACLGTALRLPMTEATLIENSIMILMALMMLA